MEKRKRKIFLLILIAFCLFALGAGIGFGVPREEASAKTFFSNQSVEDLRKTDPAEIANLKQYSSRDYHIVTPVKNQTSYSLCWAFATIAASETSILREGVGGAVQSAFFGLEERTLAYHAHNPQGDSFHLIDDDVVKGNGTWNKGGYVETAGKTMLQWLAPTRSADYRGDNAVSADYPLAYKLEDMVTVKYSVDNVKRLVAEYGAAAFSFPIHNLTSGSYTIDRYFNNINQSKHNPHACIIIGWDDTIPATYFTPDHSSTDGGWIVKNSWGSGSNDEGYFYLSYDSDIYDIWAFNYAEADAFDNQYLYNGTIARGNVSVFGDGGPAKAAAIFCAQGGTSETREELNAVNIGIGGTDVTVDIAVYKGLDPNYGYSSSPSNDPEKGELVASKSQTVSREGFYTFYLDKGVPLENGESFSVVVTAQNAAGNARIYASIEYQSTNDMTFEYKNGAWSDLKNYGKCCAHIRAYTRNVVREETVSPRDLQFASIRLEKSSFTYTGAEITPKVTVTLHGKTLQEGQDFEVRYENNRNALGNAVAIAEGRGEYKGTARAYFQIAQAKYPPNKPPFDKQQPIVVGYEVTRLKQIPLPAGWEWYFDVDLTAHECDIPHEWTIKYVVTDGNYVTNAYDSDTGEAYIQSGVYVLRESKRHDLISIAGATAVQKGACVYTGSVAKPAFTVTLNGAVLTEGTHYTVRTSAVNAGKAEAEIIGTGNYTGTLRAAFTVSKAKAPAFSWNGNVAMGENVKTLADVSLPANWQWKNGTALLTAGEMRGIAEYVGSDKANFEELTRKVVFTVSEEAAPGPDPEPDTGDTGGGSDITDNTDNTKNTDNKDNTDSADGGDSAQTDGADKGNGTDEGNGAEETAAGGLSPAAIAGISLGGVAGVGLIALAVVLVRRRLL